MNAPSKPQYVLFLRKDSPYYWVRFSIPGQGQKRIGLKTDDIGKAAELAQEEYRRAVWRAEEGLLPGKTSFDKVARQYIKSIENAAKDSPKLRTKATADKALLERYMIPFFGKSTITSINAPKLYEYLEWRRTYWTEGPGQSVSHIEYEREGRRSFRPARHIEATLSTLRREAVALRSVFKHAVRLGYIKAPEIPKVELAAEQRNKRPSFTDAEIEKLPVFVNASGERAGSFKKSLNALLEAAKLKHDAFGRARSAYSFRHTYATRQLRKGIPTDTTA
jgi:integrase